MSKILELREKRAKAWDAAKSFLDSKRDEGGLLSAENSVVYDRMEADVVALGKEVERLERQAVIDMEMARPINTPVTNVPTDPREDEKKGRASNAYKGAFWDAMRNKAPSMEIYNALKIGSDPDGGYLIPDEYERTLIQALEEECVFRRLARIIQTANGDRKIPVVASKGEASWVEEEALIPESDDKFTQISIGAHKVATTIKVSDELLNDSVFNLPAYIATEFARRIGNKEEDAFINGDGAGKPLGILSDTGGGEVGVTTAGATVITFDELMDLFYSLKSPYRRKAAFLMNDLTVKVIRKLKDNNGQYLWAPSVKDGVPDTILNKQYHTSAYMPVIAAGEKTVIFGDYSYYWIAERQGRVFKRLNELFAQSGQVGFLATQRVDGRLILPESVKILRQKSA